MSWFNTLGPCPNYVLFSKVKYIRNLAKLPFYRSADPKRLEEETSRIDKILVSNGFKGEKIVAGRSAYLLSLAEKQFVDNEFIDSELSRTVYLNEPCNLLAALGGRNLITVSSLMSGLAITEAKNIARGVEELLDRSVDFAYDERIGYLSGDICRCGSGMELSCALFLPSLRRECSYDALRSTLMTRNLSLRPMMSRGGCDFYILCHTPHHLADEEETCIFFTRAAEELVAYEQARERIIFSRSGNDIDDGAFRASAILSYASQLGEDELISLLSDIRLSLSLSGESKHPNLPAILDLNFMMAQGLSCSVISSSGNKCTNEREINELRAQLIGRYMRRGEGA